MPRHADAPAEIIPNAVLHVLGPGGNTLNAAPLWDSASCRR
jgi:hypothetical protein